MASTFGTILVDRLTPLPGAIQPSAAMLGSLATIWVNAREGYAESVQTIADNMTDVTVERRIAPRK